MGKRPAERPGKQATKYPPKAMPCCVTASVVALSRAALQASWRASALREALARAGKAENASGHVHCRLHRPGRERIVEACIPALLEQIKHCTYLIKQPGSVCYLVYQYCSQAREPRRAQASPSTVQQEVLWLQKTSWGGKISCRPGCRPSVRVAHLCACQSSAALGPGSYCTPSSGSGGCTALQGVRCAPASGFCVSCSSHLPRNGAMRAEARPALCVLPSASHPDVQNWQTCSHTCIASCGLPQAVLLYSLRAAALADVGSPPQHGRDHRARSNCAARAPVQFGRRQLERSCTGALHCSGTPGVC